MPGCERGEGAGGGGHDGADRAAGGVDQLVQGGVRAADLAGGGDQDGPEAGAGEGRPLHVAPQVARHREGPLAGDLRELPLPDGNPHRRRPPLLRLPRLRRLLRPALQAGLFLVHRALIQGVSSGRRIDLDF